MGLFGSKKKKEEVVADAKAAPKAEKAAKKAPAKRAKKAEKAETTATPAVVGTTGTFDAGRVIIGPRITEKSTMQAEVNNCYVFEIAQDANKVTVAKAMSSLYNVTPVRVSITRNPAKKVFYRGRLGMSSGVKKAYVYLKKGDKIELV